MQAAIDPHGVGAMRSARQNGPVTLLDPSTKGKLLLATPPLGDPNFDRSVVYMLEHTDAGAVGVVLNRPGPETEVEGLDDWIDRLGPPYVVFAGGPVELDALIALASADQPNDEA